MKETAASNTEESCGRVGAEVLLHAEKRSREIERDETRRQLSEELSNHRHGISQCSASIKNQAPCPRIFLQIFHFSTDQ